MQRTLLYLLVAASYLLLAGGPRWALGLLFVLATLTALAGARRVQRIVSAPGLLEGGWLLILAAVVVQLVPLPRGVLAGISPHALDLRQTLVLIPGGSDWVALSIDARATAYSLGAVALGLLTYLTARALLDRRGGVRALCRALAWGGLIAALVAVVLRAAAPSLLMGVVPLEATGTRPFGPFVNRNHFAGWLLLATPLVAGYLVAHLRLHPIEWRRRPRLRHVLSSRTLLLLIAVVVMVAVLLLTLSRSAAAGLGVAGAAWWWLTRQRVDWKPRGWRLVAAGGAALLLLAAVVDLDAWAARLEHTFTAGARPDDRLVIWRETWPIVRDFWLTGTGAGTFGTAMITYQRSRIWVPHQAGWAHFNQAHNHALQLLAEGGLLLAVPVAVALAGLVRAGRRALSGDRTEIFWVRAGAAAALVAVATQSLWDIPLAMPANTVLAAVIAAVLLHEPHHLDRRDLRAAEPWMCEEGRRDQADAPAA